MKNVNSIRKAILTTVLLLSSVVFFAQDTARVRESQYCIVTLTNGTRVAGDLIAQDSGSVKVKDAALGELTILQSNVEMMRVLETGKEYQVIMSSGKKYRGVVEAQNATSVVMHTSTLGNITLNKINISDFSSGSEGAIAPRVDHGSRYLFGPSAIPLKKGEGYYQNVWLLVNGFHYGITDRWSAGGGIVFPVGMYATAKYGRQLSDNVHVAGGGMFCSSFFGLGLGMACGFGSVTFGDRYTNATFTLGYGAVSNDAEWTATNRPIISVNGMARINDNFSLISENYLFPVQSTRNLGNGEYSVNQTYYPELTAGVRIGGGQHSWDLAMMTIGDVSSGDFFAVPFIGYVYRFSNKK